VVFFTALVAIVAMSLWLFDVASAYHAAMALTSSAALFPIFCTGRVGELPPDPFEAAAQRLEPIYRRLVKRGVLVQPSWRLPAQGGEADELRLTLSLRRPRSGLRGIEIGYDAHRGSAGSLLLPYVIVRVAEGSDALAAMPVGLLWTRGRSADEKVAVLRPRLPTRRLTVALVLEIVAALVAPGSGRGQSATRARKSSGKRASTANPAVTSSPAHAT
jgi:hypothetical protein